MCDGLVEGVYRSIDEYPRTNLPVCLDLTKVGAKCTICLYLGVYITRMSAHKRRHIVGLITGSISERR